MADAEMIEDQDPVPEGKEPLDNEASHLSELERLIREQAEALTKAGARITELEAAISESEARLKLSNDSLSRALTSYRRLVIEASPEVPEELISSDSLEAINQSIQQAKGLISRVKQGLEAEIEAARVPVGAPPRMPPDLSALSPREKIQYGVRR